ncbi:MAG: aminotransferase class IV [Deltaproteobacteria bacterium]|nr:aminotransferase class IV [Deltaproteobacteria bacterium]
MLEERIVYLDGGYVPWGEAKIHIMCHSLGRGSAIFEVIGFHDTQIGPAVFRLDEHILRFRKTAALLDMELPLPAEAISEAILETVRRNKLRQGTIKVIGYYPEVAFDILPPQKRFQIAVFVYDKQEDIADAQPLPDGGVSACLSRWCRLDPRSVPIEAKVAANYLNGIMARTEARKRGFDFAVMLDTQGFIAEGGTESIFLVHQGRLMTPSLGTILSGISRKSLLELAGQTGMPTIEGRLAPELLDEAEEIFLSCTPTKLLPVRRMGERVLTGIPGPVTRKLAERMASITAGRDEPFRRWLFPVA